MTEREKEHWLCKDCGKDIFKHSDTEYYMVKHELWKLFGVGRGMLCLSCLSKRMGRELTRDDFLQNAPVNVRILTKLK